MNTYELTGVVFFGGLVVGSGLIGYLFSRFGEVMFKRFLQDSKEALILENKED